MHIFLIMVLLLLRVGNYTSFIIQLNMYDHFVDPKVFAILDNVLVSLVCRNLDEPVKVIFVHEVIRRYFFVLIVEVIENLINFNPQFL